jgi:hypothetical protein
VEGASLAYNPETEEEYTFDPFLMLGPMAVAGRLAPSGSLGVLGGVWANTADFEKLAKAKKMMREGASREEIEQATRGAGGKDTSGWFYNNDGSWAFEISDIDARLLPQEDFLKLAKTTDYKPKPGEIIQFDADTGLPLTSLSEGLIHPAFKEAYPDASNIGLALSNRIDHLEDLLKKEKAKAKPDADRQVELYEEWLSLKSEWINRPQHPVTTPSLVYSDPATLGKGTQADFTPAYNRLRVLSREEPSDIPKWPGDAPPITSEQQTSAVLHEAQHLIDNLEGRPGGLSMAEARSDFPDAFRKHLSTIEQGLDKGFNESRKNLFAVKYESGGGDLTDFDTFVEFMVANHPNLDVTFQLGKNKQFTAKIWDLADPSESRLRTRAGRRARLRDALKTFWNQKKSERVAEMNEHAAWKTYQQVLGEADARTVQARWLRLQDQKKRRGLIARVLRGKPVIKEPFWVTRARDIPESDLLIKDGLAHGGFVDKPLYERTL